MNCHFVTTVLVAALGLGSIAVASTPSPSSAAPGTAPTPARSVAPVPAAKATFAMGCFWCGETAFEGRPGVLAVVSGYTGGKELRPTYEQVSNHATSHLEAIEISYDPRRISYEQLLEIFWHSIDPTQADGQFCDRGAQYRSAVFHHDEAQRKAAEASRSAIAASGVLRKAIVTELRPAARFWPAEAYHQDFWKKDPVRYKSYRLGCGRDARLAQLWGAAAAKPSAH